MGPVLPDQLLGLLRLSEIAKFYRTDTVLSENEKPIIFENISNMSSSYSNTTERVDFG